MKKNWLICGVFCCFLLGSNFISGVSKVAADTQDQAKTELKVRLYKKIIPDILPGEPSKGESYENGGDSVSREEIRSKDYVVKTAFLPKTGSIQNNWLLYSGIGVLISTFFLFIVRKRKQRTEVKR